MFRAFKSLLLWLIIAALPIQGVASVVKATCGPRHHAMMETIDVGSPHHSDGSTHHHHEITSNTAGFDEAPEISSSNDAEPVKSSYCSACAACCFGALAPPTATLCTPSGTRPVTLIPSPESRVTGFIPGGLERPPKPLSA